MTEPVQVTVVGGAPGKGKSTGMLFDAVQHEGRYLFAAPTISLLDEQVIRFREFAPHVTVIPIHSKTGKKTSVKRRIGDLMDHSASHLAAFITHEALLDTGLGDFTGWHARIDEPPHAITGGKISMGQSVSYFESQFDLHPIGDGSSWSTLKPKATTNWRKMANDSVVKGLIDFHKLAARPSGVFIEITSWADAGQRAIPWFSLWTPLQLHAFESIVIAGAGYLSSLGYRACREIFSGEITFDVLDPAPSRNGQPHVTIHYFTERHESSTAFWSTDEGRSCLVSICKWFEGEQREIGFWSGNEPVRTLFHDRISGERTFPKVAGLNTYRHHRSCLFLYSSKAQPHDVQLGDLLTISDDDVRRAREDEDVFQFVYRGAIREAAYAGPYEIYLYSLEQAERLRDLLLASGLIYVELEGIPEAGIMEVARSGQRRGTASASEAERKVRADKKREQGRIRAQRHRDKEKAKKDAAL